MLKIESKLPEKLVGLKDLNPLLSLPRFLTHTPRILSNLLLGPFPVSPFNGSFRGEIAASKAQRYG